MGLFQDDNKFGILVIKYTENLEDLPEKTTCLAPDSILTVLAKNVNVINRIVVMHSIHRVHLLDGGC